MMSSRSDDFRYGVFLKFNSWISPPEYRCLGLLHTLYTGGQQLSGLRPVGGSLMEADTRGLGREEARTFEH